MYSLTIFFFVLTRCSGFYIHDEKFPFLKYFDAVRSVLMMDIDGADSMYSDEFIHTLMKHGKTSYIVRPLRNNKEPNETTVKMVLTYLINQERNTGSFICMNTPNTDKLLKTNLKKSLIPFLRNPTVFVFYGIINNNSTKIEDIRPTLEDFFEKVWTDLKIPNAIGAVITPYGEPILCTYDPHKWTTYIPGRGIRFFTQDDIRNDANIFMNDGLHEHYRLNISFFERYPTSFKIRDPQPDFFKRLTKDSWGYGGLDGFLMGDAIRALKMNATLHKSSGQPYGYTSRNGTVGGTLGEIVDMKADIAFNSRFVKFYGYEAHYEYLGVIHSDNLCVVVPKADFIPLWQNVGRVYSTGVWTILLVQTLTITVLRWLQLKIVKKRGSLLGVALEIHAVIIVPVARANRTPPRERLLLVLCLLINLILVSLFQGNLHAAFNTRLTYPDINTLEEFDESGIYLYLTPGFREVFEDSSSPIYENIQSKLRLELHSSDLIGDIAEGARVAVLARETDIKLDILTNYIRPDGQPLLHVVQECPKSFKLSYIVSKNFPFKKRMKDVMNRLVEAGLPAWYYEMTEHTLTTQARANRKEHARSAHAPLRLVHVAAAFYILAAGTGLSLLCLAAEIVAHWRKR